MLICTEEVDDGGGTGGETEVDERAEKIGEVSSDGKGETVKEAVTEVDEDGWLEGEREGVKSG